MSLFYHKDTPTTIFGELREALALSDVRSVYCEFGRILHLIADQMTVSSTLHLGGLFAKIDYLCRQHHVDTRIVHGVNDLRVRYNRRDRLTDETLAECRLYDLRSLALFIGAIYACPVPVDLSKRFPQGERKEARGVLTTDYFRLYVTRWDDAFVYGHSEEESDIDELKVSLGRQENVSGEDWSYIAKLLSADCQLNIVRPRQIDDIFYPELIIFDPDYLIDVTAIAGCFEEYTHHAIRHLISRLEPIENSAAIILGNLAGQLLDEEVHAASSPVSYTESYTRFIRDNIFAALTTDISQLRQGGEQQRGNIHHALHDSLQHQVGQYDPSQVMLEPSFISEMLGIQGRMDLLQLDYRVLIEQKSGKAAYAPGRPAQAGPLPQLKHQIQALLYQAILRYNYHVPNREIQSLLLYSKFAEGLVAVPAAPDLLFEAFRVRNQIVWLEHYCSEQKVCLLDQWSPERLRQREVKETFWRDYCLPKLKAVFDPIRDASPLERAYFYRMMAFVAQEQRLSKVGNNTKQSSGAASRWHDTLEEKLSVGNIYDRLTLLEPAAMHQGQVMRLSFAFDPTRGTEMSNFRTGDAAVVYPYRRDEEPDVRRTMVFRCNIVGIDSRGIEVELRAPQSDAKVFLRHQGLWWAMEHDNIESSQASVCRGLHQFLSAPKSRRDLLMLQREPEVDASRTLTGDYGSFNQLSLRVRQARDLFLIIGPPGTGKTSYGMLNTLQEQLLSEPASSVLILSFTNRAVDEICSKLVESGIDFIRVGNVYGCEPRYRGYMLNNRLLQFGKLDEMKAFVQQTRVFVGTASSFNSSQSLFKIKRFELAIIDEASQILEPQLIGLLSAMHCDEPAIGKFVMIGDHKQLPAVVQQTAEASRVNDAQLNAIGLTDCRLSLFERLLRRYRDDARVVYMLTRQGRMHQDIADFPNKAFYAGRLQVVPLKHQLQPLTAEMADACDDIDRLLQTQRVAFVAARQQRTIGTMDKMNTLEASLIAEMVRRIYLLHRADFAPDATVGVIVPYRTQIATIRHLIEQYGHPALCQITIDTVERYQGSQRDYIIYGFTVQRAYQLNFLCDNTFEEDGQIIDRKLNVAMTRAREHLIMVGNPDILSENPLFDSLIAYTRERNSYYDNIPAPVRS